MRAGSSFRSALAFALACACVAPAWCAPVPLGGVAAFNLPPRGAHQACAPGDLERLNMLVAPARVLFCGTISDPSGLRVRYDFHRTGRLAEPKRDDLASGRVTAALTAQEAARGGAQFVGWRQRPAWIPEQGVLRWAYDVREGGFQRTLSFASLATREGVLVFSRLEARAAGFDRDERAFTALLGRVQVLPGRRLADGVSGDARARIGLADLVVHRGMPPARAAARTGPDLPLARIGMIAGGVAAALAGAWFLLRRRGSVPAEEPVEVVVAAAPPAARAAVPATFDSPRSMAPVGGLRPVDATGAPLGPLGRRLLEQVEALARDLSANELVFQPATHGELELRIAIRQNATFDIASTQGRGPLPSGVQATASRGELQQTVARHLADTRRDCGDRIDAWARARGSNYEAELTPDACLGPAHVFGHETTCGKCSGRGRVTCPSCSGRREVTCSGCSGRGRTTCSSCYGSGNRSCSSCGGSGSHTENYSTQEWDSGQNTYVTRYGTRQVSCSGCGGSGKTNCYSCSYGEVTCSGCGGRGSVSCSRCGASGTIPCDACNATGKLHDLAQVVCATTRKIGIQVTGGIPEDQRTFVDRVPFGRLQALGAVRLADTRREEHQITLAYASRVAFEAAEVNALGSRLAIRGYGPAADIFDHHGLVGVLIEPDLVALEARLAAERWWRAATGPGLIDATRRFLASELHTLATESAPGSKEAPIPALQPYVGLNLVPPGYPARAAAAGTRAVARLQDALVRVQTLWLLAAAAVALYAAQVVRIGDLHPFQRCMIVLGLTVIAWVFVEITTRRRLRGMLGAVLYRRLGRPFAAAWMRYRLVVAAGLVAACFGTAFLVYRFVLGRI